MVPYSKAHLKVALSQDIPDNWLPYAIGHTKTLYGRTEAAESLIQFNNFPEFSVYFLRLLSAMEENLQFAREQPTYFLVVQLHNTLELTLPGIAPLRLPEWSFNFLYTVDFQLDLRLKPQTVYETFFLIVPEAFIMYFAKQDEMVRSFHQRTKEKKSESLLLHPKICPPAIIKKITEMQAGGIPELSPHFAEETLSIIFDSANSLPYRRIQYEDEVIDRLYALKAFLQQNPDNNLTRTELTDRFRLTAHQFDQGFASIYGFTPFAFLKYLRTQHL